MLIYKLLFCILVTNRKYIRSSNSLSRFQKDKELVFTKVISSSELFDSDAETDGSEELKPSISTSPTLCACCACSCDTFPQFTLVPVPVSDTHYQHLVVHCPELIIVSV